MTTGLLMVKSLSVGFLALSKEALENPMELLLITILKKLIRTLFKISETCLSNQAGFYLLEYSTKSKRAYLGIGNVIPIKVRCSLLK
jgi:hypothetical protein